MSGSRRRGFASALFWLTNLVVIATPSIALAQTLPRASGSERPDPALGTQSAIEREDLASGHGVSRQPPKPPVGSPSVGSPAPPNSVSVPYSAGHHVFDRHYLFLGINHQRPNGTRDAFHRTVGELEFSWVPKWTLSERLAWAGAWLSGGFHETRDADDTRGRFGAGIQAGYRFLATDFGYIYDHVYGSGVRWRFGPALAVELSTPKYATTCCLVPRTCSRLACECDRTIKGISVFPYWAIETYPDGGPDGGPVTDGMFGVSLKFGWSL